MRLIGGIGRVNDGCRRVRSWCARHRFGLSAIALALLFAPLAPEAFARVGGGQSYSGGGSGGSGSGSGGGTFELLYYLLRMLFWLTINYPLIGIPVDVLLIWLFIKWRTGSSSSEPLVLTTSTPAIRSHRLDAIRRYDPNFSEITFSDFCYSLYARMHEARGAGNLERYAPYASDAARTALVTRNLPRPREVRGIVIGSFTIIDAQVDTPLMTVSAQYGSNVTEVDDAGAESSWYLRERWVFERQRDILSPPPAKARAEHCPRCGAPLQTGTDGSCQHCGVKIESGAFQWYVRSITLLAREARGPLLTSNVPEEGTNLPTRYQPQFADVSKQFEAANPDFQWDAFEARVRLIGTELQTAWSARDWERVRPFETDTLFQMHRFWIDAYKRQQLRNVVDEYSVTAVKPVQILSDAFYESITVRLWAQGRDYTTDEKHAVVAGSRQDVRKWTEYWTLIRSRAAHASPGSTISCPNCGASVVAGPTGVCSHCGGKLTTGEFDWVLSRIEQDEAYAG